MEKKVKHEFDCCKVGGKKECPINKSSSNPKYFAGCYEFTEKTTKPMPIEKQNWEIEFDEQFKCIQSDCDGNGCIPNQVAEGEWEAQQCKFHAEYIFPIKSFIKDILLEREKELYAKVKEYFKLTSNRGDNIGEYLARNVILQEDILEIIDQSLLDIDEK